MALAYLLGRGSSKALHTKVNIPLLMVLAILPDIDIIFDFLTGAEIHRGPTHSIIAAALIFIPIFIIYRKKAVPYFLALISHALIGDFITGGQLQLLWPFSSAQFGLHEAGFPYIGIYSPINITLELTLFLIATFVLYRTGDWKVFFRGNTSNLVLIIPLTTVLLPSIIGYPFSQPLFFTVPLLALAHLFYLVLFSIAVLKTLGRLYRKYISHQGKTSTR
jgi:membrane-bound metal-dependent hydrolase YbcI (DUF457 family)